MIYGVEASMRSPERFVNSEMETRQTPNQTSRGGVFIRESELAPWALHLAGKAAERLSHEAEAAEIFGRQITKMAHIGWPMTPFIMSRGT